MLEHKVYIYVRVPDVLRCKILLNTIANINSNIIMRVLFLICAVYLAIPEYPTRLWNVKVAIEDGNIVQRKLYPIDTDTSKGTNGDDDPQFAIRDIQRFLFLQTFIDPLVMDWKQTLVPARHCNVMCFTRCNVTTILHYMLNL
uniref:Uncharacterized protein n=1 Tax=Glossina brevipalpis TaxID=37001 RepID=A0A1A9W0F7_9MUSC